MQKLFKILGFVWVVLILLPLAVNSFNWLPLIGSLIFEGVFIFVVQYKIYPYIDWYDTFDWTMSYVTETFLGSIFAVIIPCLYTINIPAFWDFYSKILVLIAILSFIVGLFLILRYHRKDIGYWNIVVILLMLVAIYTFVQCLIQ